MYYDTETVPTVCYGQNLENSYNVDAIAAVGGDFYSVVNGS